jgi:N-acetylglucosaminyl-diphospho-decaprenol L-rhamnosyltransferase
VEAVEQPTSGAASDRAVPDPAVPDQTSPLPASGSEPDVPDIRVVVVTYRSGEVIGAFLDSVAKATSRHYEVVVVDNSATLDPGTSAAGRRGEVTLLRPGRNLGYGAGANRGAHGASARWLLIANPDVSFAPGSLDELLDAVDRWPRAGALGPAIVNPGGVLYPSARELPSLGRGIGHALLGWCWPTNPWTASYRREKADPAEGEAGWLSGACQMVRREAFEQVGGFDEAYFMFMEDVDLDRRLGLAGWRMVYVPAAVVEHLGGHSTRRRSRRMVIAHHRSLYRYLCRQYAAPAQAPLRLLLGVGLAARLAVALVFARDSAGARATRSSDLLPAAGTDPGRAPERRSDPA